MKKDHFSAQAKQYARYRFSYPEPMMKALSSVPQHTRMAWDVGTGTGQVACGLSAHFDQVVGTDISQKQIENATSRDNVRYEIRPAEDSGLADASVDLITVGQAVHWFDVEPFYREAQRVLSPGGAIALWCYRLPVSFPELDQVVDHYYHDVLGEYWAKNMKLVDDNYRTLPFPFKEVAFEQFSVEAEWTLDKLTGHLDSWSAAQEFKKQKGYDPRAEVQDQLLAVWPDKEKPVRFHWPLTVKVGHP